MEQLRSVWETFRRFARVHVDGVGRDVVVKARGKGDFGVVDGRGAGAGGADDGYLGGDDAGERVLV